MSRSLRLSYYLVSSNIHRKTFSSLAHIWSSFGWWTLLHCCRIQFYWGRSNSRICTTVNFVWNVCF